MDDRIRVSDADRERVAARLREHYAEGRLTEAELDERISAALSAKTFGDLRVVLADLPEPELVPPRAAPPRAMPPRVVVRRGPRILPLVLVALAATMLLPAAGWMFFAFLKLILLVWLGVMLAGIFAAARFRRQSRRYLRSGYGSHWHRYEWYR